MEKKTPPQPLIVSEEFNEFVDSDMSDNDELISDPNIPTISTWVARTIHAAREHYNKYWN